MISPVEKTKGPCAILAGAGTGKTYTIVEKIKYLIQNDIYKPEKIVCLTFSNEASNSLRNRILPILKDEKEPIIRTFHSFCSDLLKIHGEKIGINKNFRILLPNDAKIMLHKNFRVPVLNCHRYVSAIGTSKDLGITIKNFEEFLSGKKENTENIEKVTEDLKFRLHTLHLEKDKEKKKDKPLLIDRIEKLERIISIKRFIQAWKNYEKMKSKRNYLDYSDLNMKALELLENHPEITKDYSYIIIDEFQDTNKLQFDFIKRLANNDITVVGDLNQSIYGFRGAYKENFENFKKSFNVKESDIFALDKSFRSTNKILEIAHSLIENNYKNKEECFKVTNAHNIEGDKIKTFELKNYKEEVRKIIEIIKQEQEKGTQLEDICITFRTHQQTKLLKKHLENESIPFTSISTKNLMKISYIKEIINYLKIIDSISNKSKSDGAWWEIINSSNFSGEDSIKLSRFIKENREDRELGIKIINNLIDLGLSEDGRIRLEIIKRKIKDLLPFFTYRTTEILKNAYRILGMLPENENEEKEKALCLQKFYEIAEEYSEAESSELQDFLYHINIINLLGIDIDSPSLLNSGVRIMTAHSTKGLEYKTVILSNMAQKIFPIEKTSVNNLIPTEIMPEIKESLAQLEENEKEDFIREYEKNNQLSEERRLCYVALTRAKSNLFITYAKEYYGKKFYPSQFLNEVNYKRNKIIEFSIDNDEKYILPLANNLNIEIPLINTKEVSFSQSALLLFSKCQKKYEYKYIYNMPDPETTSLEQMQLGSFIHHVAEIGVRENLRTEEEFLVLTKRILAEEKWNTIKIEEAIPIIKVFFERNKNKYNEKSETEISLGVTIDGIRFFGYADRIDFTPEGLEIIDYKTGNSFVEPKARNWQLGLYVLGAENIYKQKVKRVTLDMLKKDKPLEFELDDLGNAKETGGRMYFNINQVRQEILETAKSIIDAYKSGFQACSIERNCDFCNEHFWGI